jgi:hypothetical protein
MHWTTRGACAQYSAVRVACTTVHLGIRASFSTGDPNLEELRCHRVQKAPSWMTKPAKGLFPSEHIPTKYAAALERFGGS